MKNWRLYRIFNNKGLKLIVSVAYKIPYLLIPVCSAHYNIILIDSNSIMEWIFVPIF